MLLLDGCVDVDYVGQRFDPPPGAGMPVVFGVQADYPKEDYRPFGRAVFTAPADYGILELQEKAENTAREYGADAVKIVFAGRSLMESPYRMPQADGSGRASSDGMRPYVEAFGDEAQFPGARIERHELVVKALMLMKRERFARLMSERGAKTAEAPDTDSESGAAAVDRAENGAEEDGAGTEPAPSAD